MSDHLITLPAHWQYIDQFKASQYAPQPSQYRCVAASAVMAAEVAYPNQFNPELAEHLFYQEYAGPDVVSDHQGIGKASLLKWFSDNKIGFIDMQDLVDSGNMDHLREEMSAQNRQDVLQVISVADESHLHFATIDAAGEPVSGQKLHNWNDVGLSHCFVRLGYSDSMGWGYYAEPAAAGFSYDAKGNWRPIPILWSDITAGQITSCIAVMPHTVSTPPAGFRYYRGNGQPDALWPEPKVEVQTADLTKAFVEYHTLQEQMRVQSDAAFVKLMAELGVKL